MLRLHNLSELLVAKEETHMVRCVVHMEAREKPLRDCLKDNAEDC